MQIMPGTAKELGINPYNFDQNIDGGVRYYSQLRKKYGDPVTAAGAYNAGPGRMDAILAGEATRPRETTSYMAKFTSWLGSDPSPNWGAAPKAPAAEPAFRGDVINRLDPTASSGTTPAAPVGTPAFSDFDRANMDLSRPDPLGAAREMREMLDGDAPVAPVPAHIEPGFAFLSNQAPQPAFTEPGRHPFEGLADPVSTGIVRAALARRHGAEAQIEPPAVLDERGQGVVPPAASYHPDAHC
jgi:hypothetical protein